MDLARPPPHSEGLIAPNELCGVWVVLAQPPPHLAQPPPIFWLNRCKLSGLDFGRGDDASGNPHRAHIYQFEILELLLLLKLDNKPFSIERFEPTVSQSTVPPLLPMAWRNYSDPFRIPARARNVTAGYVYICIYVHAYVQAHVYTYTYTYLRIHIHTHMS